MNTISLAQETYQNITVIPNQFIDDYMVRADGEYVKIYLMILRLTGQNVPVTADKLADSLELTVKDILRAVRYWEKEGLLSAGGQNGPVTETLTPVSSPLPVQRQLIPGKRSRNAAELNKYISGTDLERLVFMAETYIGHPLSVQELNSICYISDDLRFPTDLLEYLVEYCSEKGKKQIRYMEKVAINWYEQGIDTVRKAMDQTSLYTRNVFSVMKAFGISGRNPGQSEMDYITRWNSMGFDTEIIVEACNRTLLTTHQASFPYANRILEGWKKAGVRKLSDIISLDKKHHAGAEDRARKKEHSVRKSGSNAFHNFEQRSYDYDDLELRLAGKGGR